MDNAILLSQIQAQVSEAAEFAPKDPKWVKGGEELRVVVPASRVRDVAAWAKGQGFDLLDMLTAIDWVKENRFELVYFFQKSAAPAEKFFLKADLPRDAEPVAPTLTDLYDGANWQERETYDLLGIKFQDHPDLRRILLWEGYPGWPLRKDYVHTLDIYDNGSEIGLPKKATAPHESSK
jgi:NADH:ubiquinone oxidoreductase subunit C